MDWETVRGNLDAMKGRLRERYGMAKDQADREVDSWLSSLDEDDQPRS